MEPLRAGCTDHAILEHVAAAIAQKPQQSDFEGRLSHVSDRGVGLLREEPFESENPDSQDGHNRHVNDPAALCGVAGVGAI